MNGENVDESEREHHVVHTQYATSYVNWPIRHPERENVMNKQIKHLVTFLTTNLLMDDNIYYVW